MLVPGRVRRGFGWSSWSRPLAAALTLVTLAACTPASPPPAPTPTIVDPWSEHGPITLAAGDSAIWPELVTGWNSLHPGEPVTLVNLPVSSNRRLAAITERAQANSGEYTVIALEPPWTGELAAKGWLTELPAGRFAADGMAPAAFASASWQKTLYAYPVTTDAGLLYYRSDLLADAGVAAPVTRAALQASCRQVGADSARSCFGLSLAKDEPLTVAFTEAVVGAGGQVLTSAGEPGVESSAAVSGLDRLAEDLDSRIIPEAALSWSEADAVREFAKGNLVFLRGWATAGAVLDSATPGTVVVGKTGLALLPGQTEPAASVLGGENLAISAFARNRGTAADFLAYAASDVTQRRLVEKGSIGPVLSGLYGDADLVARHPYLSVLDAALKAATVRPATQRYSEVTLAIQDQANGALRGEKTADQALTELQGRLEALLK